MDIKIPDGYIEKAESYALVPKKEGPDFEPIEIGGQIMMNFIVREQMTIDNIVATTGIDNKRCVIFVDYTKSEVIEMIGIAKRRAQKLIDAGLLHKDLTL